MVLLHNIYKHGRRYDSQELVEQISGQPFSSIPYANYLDAKYKEAAAGIQGNQIPAASHTQAAIQGEYRVASVPGLRFNGNINYIGKAMLQATNLNEIPAATTIDLSASYRTQIAGRGAMFFVALRNVADRKHWTIYNSGTPALQPGLPRTLSLSAQFDF